MNIVPRQNTPVAPVDAERYLVQAVTARTGAPPSRQVARLLLALFAEETGNGTQAQNYSPGNVTASAAWAGDAWRPPWFDVTPESSPRDQNLHAKMLQGQAPSAFRAYDSWPEGFANWWDVLVKSFPEVVAAAATGDPVEFTRALSKKYSRDYANPAAETQMTRLAAQYDPLLGGLPDAPLPLVVAPPPAQGGGSTSASSSSEPQLAQSLLRAAFGSSDDLVILRRGMKGPDVAWVQMRIGPLSLDIDGDFGPLTEIAVKRFQLDNGLNGDGEIGLRTWRMLLNG